MNNDEKVNDTSFSTLQIDENYKIKALLSIITNEHANGGKCDELLFALMSNINKDPVNYKEAMQTGERERRGREGERGRERELEKGY